MDRLHYGLVRRDWNHSKYRVLYSILFNAPTNIFGCFAGNYCINPPCEDPEVGRIFKHGTIGMAHTHSGISN